MCLDPVWKRIDELFGGFPPQLRRAAQFVRDRPQDVAFSSLRSLSRKAGVSPASMTRLFQSLDFQTFDAFQDEHRQWLAEGARGAFSGRAERLVGGTEEAGAQDALLDAVIEAERANVAAALEGERRRLLKDAARMIVDAPAVIVAGMRSCFPVAYSLYYALSLFLLDVRIMTGTGGSMLDDLRLVRPDDVLVVVSVQPYSRETVEAARLARGGGARVIAMTDSALSPIARLAELTLVTGNASPAHIASPIGPLAAAHALASLALALRGEAAVSALKEREAALESISAYLVGEDA